MYRSQNKKITVASLCLNSGPDSPLNISKAVSYVNEAAINGAQWIVLPEMFTFMGPYKDLHSNILYQDSEDFKYFCKIAHDLKVVIFLGTIPEKSDTTPSKVFNTLYVINRDGRVIAKYRKTHLFNLNGRSKATTYRESDGYIAGNHFVTLEIDGFQTHLSICYDIRFSAMFNLLQSKKEADVIICPSAFTQATGKRHWHLLMRARAIEYQCYVIASAQTGEKSNHKKNYGHALICDPWGNVISDTGESEGIAYATICKDQLQQYRESLPILNNQRNDLYNKHI